MQEREQQVTIRGDRVDVDGIEQVLRGYENVREAAVAVHAVGGDEKLIAYVVAEGLSPTVSQLRTYLQDRVPPSMMPSVFVSLDRLPVTDDGAVDRSALPPPNPIWSAVEQHYVAPRNAIETAIAEIWAEALLVERVGIHDDFLELGGDSLIATQVVAKIWERLGTEVPFQSLFERGSIAELVEEYFAGASEPQEQA